MSLSQALPRPGHGAETAQIALPKQSARSDCQRACRTCQKALPKPTLPATPSAPFPGGVWLLAGIQDRTDQGRAKEAQASSAPCPPLRQAPETACAWTKLNWTRFCRGQGNGLGHGGVSAGRTLRQLADGDADRFRDLPRPQLADTARRAYWPQFRDDGLLLSQHVPKTGMRTARRTRLARCRLPVLQNTENQKSACFWPEIVYVSSWL